MAVSHTLILAPNVVARNVVVDIETSDGDGMWVIFLTKAWGNGGHSNQQIPSPMNCCRTR